MKKYIFSTMFSSLLGTIVFATNNMGGYVSCVGLCNQEADLATNIAINTYQNSEQTSADQAALNNAISAANAYELTCKKRCARQELGIQSTYKNNREKSAVEASGTSFIPMTD